MKITDLERYIKQKKLDAHKVARQAFFEVALDVIQNTPVDTGFAKGSWTFSENSTRPTFNASKDPQGSNAISRLSSGLDGATEGATLYLLSNLVYMPRLEYGWSMQAPNGMVRVAVARFKQAVKDQLNAI